MSRRASTASVAAAAAVFAALGDQTRLGLVARLCAEGPLSIIRLSERTPVSRQAVSKHLQTLADAGLVRDTRDGRRRIWRIEPQQLLEAGRWLDGVSAQWDAALDRLKSFVEGN